MKRSWIKYQLTILPVLWAAGLTALSLVNAGTISTGIGKAFEQFSVPEPSIINAIPLGGLSLITILVIAALVVVISFILIVTRKTLKKEIKQLSDLDSD